MIIQDSVLVQLIRLIDRIPTPPPRRPRGRPKFYPEKLFFKALVIMIVRRLHRMGELLAVLDGDDIYAEITDDGRGSRESSAEATGSGLSGLAERVASFRWRRLRGGVGARRWVSPAREPAGHR